MALRARCGCRKPLRARPTSSHARDWQIHSSTLADSTHAYGCGLRQTMHIEVIDDGRGFDPAGVTRSGLRGLADRIEAVGGSLRIVSRPGEGTRVSAELPLGAQTHG